MKRWRILPGMALKGVMANKTAYYPYLMAGCFSVFTYFVFTSILWNDLTKTLPRAAYAWIFLELGRWLLGVILLIFLCYANSFLIKRRKKELGLYTLLGLEKKHIALMLFLESLLIYAVVTAGGIIFGLVLSKLLFLLLLKLSNLPADVKFVLAPQALKSTMFYFAAVFFLNYLRQLWGLSRVRPIELFSEGRKGEKEPKLLFLWALLGILTLGLGYSIAIRSEVDSNIFLNFFLAVFLVIVGTGFLFTSGSVAFLKILRTRRGIYYKPANFITISGMYYRMKKSAASLVNICIFSTMVVITLICTLSLYIGIDGFLHFYAPYDYTADFNMGAPGAKETEQETLALVKKYDLAIERVERYDVVRFSCVKRENCFETAGEEIPYSLRDVLYIMTLEDYNRMNGEKVKLEEGEVLIYSSGEDFGYDTAEIMGIRSRVRDEIQDLPPYPKAGINSFDTEYVAVVKDWKAGEEYVAAYTGCPKEEGWEMLTNLGIGKIGVLTRGEKEEKEAFVKEFSVWCQGQEGFRSQRDGIEARESERSMYGGLLFIGIIFGLVFFMCLIIIMYYKQISEGYEDQGSFDIMQKVGMSNREIKRTIHRQILLVFVLPLAGALSHTAAGMFMVERLMTVLGIFDLRLIRLCALLVSFLFILVYAVSYLITARTYYRIVRR